MRTSQILRSPLALAVPPVLLCLCVQLWAVDVLNWDEWVIWTGVLERLQSGALSLADLAAQQNEQRNLAARLFGVALMPVFALNRLPECALNILLAGGIFLLARRLFIRTGGSPGEHALASPLLPFSLLAFSLLQWESFSVGINSSVLLPPLAMWAGAVLATGGALTWTRLGLMVLVGLVPSFSFVNGLFYWLCLAPLVALRAERQAAAKTLAFLAAGALVWAAYFHGYTSPPHHPSPLASLARPHLLLGYFLAYLGGGVVSDRNLLPLALAAGALALCMLVLFLRPALAGLARRDWRQAGRELAPLAPWLCVAAFTLLSALATAAGRSGFGLGQAQESRYATFSTPLWMVLAALSAQRGHLTGEAAQRFLRSALAFCLALFLLSSVLSAIVLRNRAPRLAQARAELLRLTDPQKLEAVFPDPAYVIRKLPLFLDRRVAIYRGIKPLADYALADGAASGDFSLRPGAGVQGRLCGYLLTGHRADAREGLVLLALPGRVAAVAQAGAGGRFELFVPDNALPEGPCVVRALELMPDGRTLRPLSPAAGVELQNSPCPPPLLHVEKYFHVR